MTGLATPITWERYTGNWRGAYEDWIFDSDFSPMSSMRKPCPVYRISMKLHKHRRNAWTALMLVLFATYYLSSIPGLRVLPVLKQVNALLQRFDLSLSVLAAKIAASLPDQLAPARTISGDFYAYARQNPVIMEFLLRKTAHVLLFFVITLVLFILISQYLKSPGWALILSFLSGSAIAFLDEYHQGFVDQRVGSLVDVAIDLVGVTMAAVMIFLSLLLTVRWRNQY